MERQFVLYAAEPDIQGCEVILWRVGDGVYEYAFGAELDEDMPAQGTETADFFVAWSDWLLANHKPPYLRSLGAKILEVLINK